MKPAFFWLPAVALGLGVLAGNLLRIPAGGGAVTALDFAAVLAAGWLIFFDKKSAPGGPEIFSKSAKILAAGLFAALGFSLFWGAAVFDFSRAEILAAGAYFLRLGVYGGVIFLLADRARAPEKSRAAGQIFWLAAGGLFLAGLLQLKIFPTISPELAARTGWDPHDGRMFSSWLDPNFLGGFFAFAAILAADRGLDFFEKFSKIRRADPSAALQDDGENRAAARSRAAGILFAGVAGIFAVGVVLTFSRAGLVALVAGGGLLAAIRAPRLFALGAVALAVALAASPRLALRAAGIFEVDETASLRIESWADGIEVFEKSPVFGVGFNFLEPVRARLGQTDAAGTHAAAGIENSHLTILATGGAVGAILWIFLWAEILRGFWRGRAAGLFAGTAGLLIHAIFINSLLFPFVLAGWGLAVAGAGFLEKNPARQKIPPFENPPRVR